MNTNPMLAAAKPRTMSCEEFWSIAQKHLPLIVQPKLDGIRCIIDSQGMPRTRTGHKIPNLFIRETLLKLKLPEGLDGEILTYSSDNEVYDFNTISSEVRSERGAPNFRYEVFDLMGNDSFTSRYGELIRMNLPATVHTVETIYQSTVELIQDYLKGILSKDGEGIILRKPTSPYKHGRVTFNEFYLVKVKPFERAEATIIGFEQEISQGGVAYESVGALLVKAKGWKESFKVGTGFDANTRYSLWLNRDYYVGRKIYFKYQENRSHKDRPIHPVFEGLVI